MKRLRIIAPLTAAVLALTGCAMAGNAGSGPATLDPSAKPEGSITVWSWDAAATSLKRLAAEYQSAHPGTTVKVVDVGYDNAYDKLSVGLQAGTGLPDVVTMETDHTPGYLSQFPKGFVDLTPIVGSKKADFDPSKWAASTDKTGAIRAVPWDSGTVGLFYRSDYLQKAGVDPASLGTWDELVSAGERIKTATGHTLITADVATGGLFQMLLQQQGQGLFDAKGDITVATPQAVAALRLEKELNDKGLLKNVKGWDARVTSAKNGDSAVTPEAVWWIATLTGEAAELSGKYGVIELPAFADGGARTSNNGGSGLAVPAQSKNPQLAASFVAFALADSGNQVSMMEKDGLFPSYLPALKDPFFSTPDPYFGGQKVYTLFAEQTAKIPAITYTADNAKASDIVGAAVSASVLGGKDPEAALQDAAKQIATATGRSIAG
ncbi:extracellular solute-binding protein [Leifsonia sp. NPDC080035]|uniref:Extracellular solute-binding protein n=1 Tax=Leifsonia sp. NPDC080035 TaxID=3143936 RepID=A0AAU7GGV9_9MICO